MPFVKLTKTTNGQEAGQTLIETLVAIFILVMGIVAALGLAIYALNSSTNVTKQITAIGLAREGVEAVRNMRDSNWLRDTLAVNSCYDFSSAQNNNADCYLNWLGAPGWNGNGNDKGFGIDPGNSSSSQTYTLIVDTSSNHKQWNFTAENRYFGLDLDTNIGDNSFAGFFIPVSTNSYDGNSDYYRTITLVKDTAAPYDKANLSRLIVKSQVWWVDKKCPRVRDFNSAKTTCRVELDSYLTNWKDF